MTPAEMAALEAICFPNTVTWTAAQFDEFTAQQGAMILSTDAGFLAARQIGDEAEIITLAVVPSRRRHGEGRRILTQVLDKLRHKGALSVFLEVADTNLAAKALYTSSGFAEAGRRKQYYRQSDGTGIDAVVLRLAL